MEEVRKSNYDSWIDINRTFIEGELGKIIDDLMPGNSVVEQGVKYSVLNGGKRVRPILCIEIFKACKIFNKKLDKVLPVACAIELTHVNSLIQDDLPCMDNDDLRRGKPSSHIKYGEAKALLASDLLLTESFKIIAESETDDKTKVEIIKLVSDCAGGKGMIAGQALDLDSESKKPSEEILRKIDFLKTAKLIEASVVSGLIFAGANENKISAGKEYSKCLGIAFQLTDDVLDIKGDEKLLGKKTGSDDLNDKATYVKIFGLDETEKKAKEQVFRAISAIEKYPNTEILIKIAESVVNRIN